MQAISHLNQEMVQLKTGYFSAHDAHLHGENNSPQSAFYIDWSQPMIAPVT